MKRDAYQRLLDWKESRRRKPLILRGARQTGKTYLLQQFGAKEFDGLVYINFERDPSAGDLFADRLRPDELLKNLSIYARHRIRPGRDLLVLDEIQASDRALNALKYFQEEAPDMHVAAAGSLLGITLSGPASFPVGKVRFQDLYPMTFLEFLEAAGHGELRTLIESTETPEPYPAPFHQELCKHLRYYYFTGGMPEAVERFVSEGSVEGVREVHQDILEAYVLDFAKYASSPDIPKLRRIWDAIPSQLAKANKKFMFSHLKKSARMRDFEHAIEWLEKSGLIHRVFRVKTAKRPLKVYAEENVFKMYTLDTGLIGAMANIPSQALVQGERFFREYEGALVENYVAQELKAVQGLDLYYWESSGTAEVDFVCEHDRSVYPLEAKAGVNTRSRSLSSFDARYAPPYLGRTSLLNLRRDGRILNLPLYAVSLFPFPRCSEDAAR